MSAPWPLSAHVGYLFTEVPLEARFAAAAEAGFDAVEHPAPFAVPAPTMERLLRENGLQLSQLTAGRGGEGEKGLASLPGREGEFREALARALDYAEAVGCPLLHPLAGRPSADTPRERAEATWLHNVAAAQEACRGRPVDVLVEPISHATVPGFFLDTLARLDELLPRLPEPPCVLLDTHHAAANGEDGAAAIASGAWPLGHLHVADHPGRHEPGTGMIDFPRILDALRTAEFQGAIGFEYLPQGATAAGLGWLPAWRERIADLGRPPNEKEEP